MTHQDVLRVLKDIEEDNRPRTCSIDDMAQYVDEALAICLATPQMNSSQLFIYNCRNRMLSTQVDEHKEPIHKGVMTAVAAMRDHKVAAPAVSNGPRAASVIQFRVSVRVAPNQGMHSIDGI